MSHLYIRYLVITALCVGLALSGPAMAENSSQASAGEVESPEIELIRLELEYACELSPGCREKNDELLGRRQVEIPQYNTGVDTSLSVLSIRGEPEFREVDPSSATDKK